MTYEGNLGTYLDWVVYFFGAYELPVLFFLRDVADRCGNDLVFADIGANVGHHTLFMAPLVGAVQAFEPLESVRKSLQRKLRDNRVENVTVHPVGLGEKDEVLPFYHPPGSNTGIGSFVPESETTAVAGQGLPVVRGDTYCESMGIKGIDLIKMDIEGFEVPALRGMKRLLAESRPVIVMEFDGRTRSRLDGESALTGLAGTDYCAFHLRGPRNRFMFLSEPAGVYRLAPFEFSVDGTAVLVPREMVEDIPRGGSG